MLLTNEKKLQEGVALAPLQLAVIPQPYKPREKVHTFARLTPARLRPS